MILALSITLGVLSIIFGIVALVKKARVDEMSDWKVGDKLIIKSYGFLAAELKKNGADYGILVGWSKEEVLVDMGADYVKQISYSDIETNKSARWRRIENRCQNYMGEQRLHFNGRKKSTSDEFFDGQDISTLNETQLNVYLKKALNEEKYEIANKIKKQLERFR